MVVNPIKVYARLKKEDELNEKSYEIIRRIPKYEDIVFYKGVLVDSSAKFRFYEIFDQNTDQDIIFETIAKPVVNSVLQGFNGTIFAYGQTGSGKTYSMTGSTKKYQERGIIPRSLQFIFSAIEKTAEKPTLYISYMEIYNEICYDLLSPKDVKTASRLEELPRVAVSEDKKGEARLRNLSVIPVSTEEEAMRLLFLGDTNRAIAETPLNEYSSRSHCIFTIYITSRSNDTTTLRYSKLNLVDLAGSERVYKSHITGSTLNEAKHINLSLHFLQQVILALSESKRLHIPYRNSLMTFILKDSLAGNCLTVMLATLAISRQNILETISTCRFAQRVSLIKTEPIINEVSDPYQEILLLKNEIQELKKQLANRDISVLKLENISLTNMQRKECENKLDKFLNSQEETFKIELDAKILQYCFSIFKSKIQKLQNQQLEVDYYAPKANGPCSENLQNNKIITKDELSTNNFLPEQDNILLQEFISSPKNNDEISYYTKILSNTYEKAKILALTIEECQTNITYIREKLTFIGNAGCSRQKILLSRELEYQQNIYRKSLVELKELKQETMQLEAGLDKAKARMMNKFNEWITSTEHSKMIDKKKTNHKMQFEDDLSIIKSSNSGGHCFGKPLELDQDFDVNDDALCQCENCNQLDSLTYRKYPQYQNYLHNISEFSEDDLNQNGSIQRHYATGTTDSCCTFIISHNQKPQRKKSGVWFGELNNDRSECACNENHLPNFKNNVSKVPCSYDSNYDHVNKNVIKQNTGHAHFKDSCKDCDCNNDYSGNMLTSSKYIDNENAQKFTNLGSQPPMQCCYNEEHNVCVCDSIKARSLQHSYRHTNSLKSNNTISMTDHNLTHSDVLPYNNNKKDYSNFKASIVSPKLKNINSAKKNLNSGSSVEGLVYLDTQLVPNKLNKDSTTKEFVHKVRSTETKTIISGRSPDCQEIPVTNDKTTEQYCVLPNRQEMSTSTVKLSFSSTITSTTKAIMDKSLNDHDKPSGSHSLSKRNSNHDYTVSDKNSSDIIETSQTKIINNFEGESINTQSGPNKKYDIFLDSDTEDFRKFMKDISLTGDKETDMEICDFYRSKLCS